MDDNTNKLFEDFKGRDVLDGISADNFDSLRMMRLSPSQTKNTSRICLGLVGYQARYQARALCQTHHSTLK